MSLILQVDDNLHLRLAEPHLAAEAFAVIDRNREHIARWMSWPSGTKTAEDVEAYARRTLAEFAERKQLSMWVYENGKLVGGAGWTDWNEQNLSGAQFASADIGYWLSEDATGRGIMTRCVRALLDLAFREYSLHRITIRCEVGNAGSSGIPKRLGFKKEGVMRHACRYADRWVDHELYAMLADEWSVAGEGC